jgi:RNA polymerase sigma-70 factor (ECF subfamily)
MDVKADGIRGQVDQTWRAERAHLVNLAFRMLRDIGAAEDTVSEAFTRLMDARFEDIADRRGWLIVVTTRLCIDQLRSAHARWERPGQPERFAHLAQPADGSPVDPADRVTLDDQVHLALLVVLQRLSPAERVVFVLHEVFGLRFDEIAESTGRSTSGCRQLARRARMKVRAAPDGRALPTNDPVGQAVTDTFIAACATGNLQALLSVLAPDVHGEVELGADAAAKIPHVVGADRVAANLLRFWGQPATLVAHPVAGQPAVLGFIDRRLSAILMLTLDGALITKVHVIGDPIQLTAAASQLA